jgi:WD40 repeat protein
MKNKKSQVTDLLESTVKPLLELKFDSPLFAIAAHPSRPILALGLANGYVFVLEYDPLKLQKTARDLRDQNRGKKEKDIQKAWRVSLLSKESDLKSGVKILWKTKRHKGSVRSICFNSDGEELYTIGSDSVLKKAQSQTGKVLKKTTIERCAPTRLYKSETHRFLVLGDEEGDIRVIDSEDLTLKKTIKRVHEDAINGIVPMKHKSAYQFLSVGSTTLSLWDTRRDKVKIISENQEDEMLSACFVDPEDGETLLCGMGEGVATVWKQSKNEFTDQISRIKITKDESVDCVISTLQNDDCCWCGCSSGDVFKVDVKRGKLVESRVHSFTDEVGFLDLDFEYRLITAGMDKLKLWAEEEEEQQEEEDQEQYLSSQSDSDSIPDFNPDEEFQGFSDSEEPEPQPEPQPEPEPVPKKKQKLSTKQVRNMQKHEHGIRRFDDL